MKMKRLCETKNIILILIYAGTAWSILNYAVVSADDSVQEKTVIIKAGLTLHNTPDADSKKIGRIPFGEVVEITESSAEMVTIDNKSGHWVKVKWKKLNGWAFDAFLGEKETSALLNHFKAISIRPIEESCCFIYKNAGENRMKIKCDCGNNDQRMEPVNKPATVKRNSVVYYVKNWNCDRWDNSGEYEQSNCILSKTTFSECAIDSKKILATKNSETLKINVKCKEIKEPMGDY